jgi:hypothetical protein
MTEIDYRDNDDLYLYDSVIESFELNHRDKSITFHILKVIDRVDRNQGFTYKVKQGTLKFTEIIYSNVSYGMQWNNWSEFYRSAVLTSSELLMKVKKRLPIIQERKYRLKHVYLGINSDDDYHEIEIVCTDFSLDLGADEFILHDDFDWLYEK